MKTRILGLLAILFLVLFACKKEDPVFDHVSTLVVTDDLQIGRVLFYDKQLSINNSVACASCHKQQFAFADNVAFSTGFNNQKTLRNSPPIQNLGSSTMFPGMPPFQNTLLFWDGRESNLKEMMVQPMVNHREMGITDLDMLAEKLEAIDYYKELFIRDYNDPNITPELIASELQKFVMTITSTNKFDQQFQSGNNFSPQEKLGMNLFFTKYECSSCHLVQQFSGYGQGDPSAFANIGLDKVYADKGLGGLTNNNSDNGKFRIPSLKNTALTAPYMHNGRFATLDEVIDHYSHGMSNHNNLDDRLKNQVGNVATFNITDHEKRALISFLNTLTDFDMISDPNLSDPFTVKYK